MIGSVSMRIAEYLLARIAEDERRAERSCTECAALRRIVEVAETVDRWERNAAEDYGIHREPGDTTSAGCDILHAIASIYADHPDYPQVAS